MSKQQRHIHIVGCSPRSGTTLMQELMTTCFEFSDFCEHEVSVFKSQNLEGDIVCTKHPRELVYMPWLLRVDPALYSIYLLRDPRSVITSKHKKAPEKYFASLYLWKENEEVRKRFKGHKRFLVVKYEDLVRNPDSVQNDILKAMPFLKFRYKFSEFYKHALPSARSKRALNDLRPISTDSLDKWRNHLERIKSEMAVHGDFSEQLIELGYEKDTTWIKMLSDVETIEFQSEAYNHRLRLVGFKMSYRAFRKTVEYCLRRVLNRNKGS